MITMRLGFFIIPLLFLLFACKRDGSALNKLSPDGLESATVVVSTSNDHNKEVLEKWSTDSLIIPYDSLFSDLQLVFTEISQEQFQFYTEGYALACKLNQSQFIKDAGIEAKHHCNELCETYLYEISSNRKMLLPSNFDAGILKMVFSPSCKQLLICSSYDGPDFENYYSHRSEIFLFSISLDYGLSGITPSSMFYTKDWSIDSIIWLSDHTIALKTYTGSRPLESRSTAYEYYKGEFPMN